ncbi:hypothetical protein HDU91_003426, partial [Kappamyces sp. JEL0680]
MVSSSSAPPDQNRTKNSTSPLPRPPLRQPSPQGQIYYAPYGYPSQAGYAYMPSGAVPYGTAPRPHLGVPVGVPGPYGPTSRPMMAPQPYRPFVPVSSGPGPDSDTVSLHSTTTTTTSVRVRETLIPHENLEAYRQEVKKSKDPIKQFDFAKQLILVAEGRAGGLTLEMRKNPQGIEANKVRKNRDILHTEALKWIKKAATATYNGKTGYPEALFFLADSYGNGTLGLTIDHERAFGYYTQGAKHDHPASIYRTGVCYEVGAGPKRDHLRAVQYYKKAAALGDTAAMFKAGMILLEGSLGQAKNPREGVNFLKRAAAQADETTPYALHELAILYEGTNLDPATGVVP